MLNLSARYNEAVRCQMVLYLNIIRDVTSLPPSFIALRADLLATYDNIWESVVIAVDLAPEVAETLQSAHREVMGFVHRLSRRTGVDLTLL